MSRISMKNTTEKIQKSKTAVERAFSVYLRSRLRKAQELAGGVNMDLPACKKEVDAIASLLADFHKTR